MIDALDAALAFLLDRHDAPEEIRDADVSFEAPDRGFRPTGPTVNLFLASVQEDVDLRPADPRRRIVDGRVETQLAPLRVECRYLLTTWTPSLASPAATTATEHRMLGAALAWLAQFPVLPADALASGLANQPAPVRLRVGLPNQAKDSEIWSSLGATIRPAAWVAATIALPQTKPPLSAPAVSAVTVGLASREVSPSDDAVHVVAGHLRDPDGSPIRGAVANLEPLGRQTSTDPAGTFRFTAVPSGTYQLRASSTSHQDRTWTVEVPPDTNRTYDAELQPRS